jgi:hypothetical protein
MRLKAMLFAATTAGVAVISAAHGASAQAAFGSAALGTYRECAGQTVCDGAQPGQTIIATNISGGGSSTSNLNFTLNGGTGYTALGAPVTLPNDPTSHVSGSVTFGAEDLPVLRSLSYSGATDRMNINEFGYQSYTNNGPTATLFNVEGDLHIDSFNGTPDGVYAGGAIAVSYLAVWDPSLIAGLGPNPSAVSLINNVFLPSCGTAGVLAANTTATNLVTGVTPNSPTLSGTTGSCNNSTSTSDALMLAPGQTVLVVAGLQLPTNRDGGIDATSTFTTSFTQDVNTQELVSGSQELAVPEPATWALLIGGFGLTGAVLRRRRTAASVA